MKTFRTNRPTIYDIPQTLPPSDYTARIPDAGRRRRLSFSWDFDTRAVTLGMKIEDDWEPHIKEMWQGNKDQISKGLAIKFGVHALDRKVENFVAIDTKPMSILAYHNELYPQVRDAYVMGQYYPALVGACALGERILNHLILDMRSFFTASPEYKQVYRKDSFDNWDVPINALEAWGILLPGAVAEFRELKLLRHRSLHFNVSTYDTLKEDALAAILHMRTIIDQQFGTFGLRPWFIEGTRGQIFIRKAYEEHPFIKTYFVPHCALVGPLFGMGRIDGGMTIFDVPDYGDGDWTDEEFATMFNDRDPDDVVTEPPEILYVGKEMGQEAGPAS
ncbi:hypothetical protein CLG96_05855 [Sphingomonas oleivorans]|uniref:Uncharacterized protein n=1 Tax=Sphingomonas oleivorans TaxID=1735121 RepID=A0A2T5FZG2_9SPHN|nr:hypothetical protein [Sphingomonas oleivorans]PTQ12091.1 hypothetical protein CLG96_05855 [Sphingomonas oleivorans]